MGVLLRHDGRILTPDVLGAFLEEFQSKHPEICANAGLFDRKLAEKRDVHNKLYRLLIYFYQNEILRLNEEGEPVSLANLARAPSYSLLETLVSCAAFSKLNLRSLSKTSVFVDVKNEIETPRILDDHPHAGDW